MKQIKTILNMSAYTLVVIFILLMSINNVQATQSPVDLGTAEDFVILTKSGVSTTGTTAITGNIGVSPVSASYITGFNLIADSSNQFSTSSLVTGKIYAADYAVPTSTILTTAVSDMKTAYTDAAGRTETNIVTELGAGDISGLTIKPGLYKWGTGVLINNDVTLSGDSNDIWIFQIAQDLTVGNGAIITLSGGAQPENIFWQVAGQTTLGTTSQFNGIILCQTLIEMQTGATLNGRALAQTAVTLDANTVTTPSTSSDDSETDSDSSTCYPNWDCTDWTTCDSSNNQIRSCNDKEDCDNDSDKPTISRDCVYVNPNLETDDVVTNQDDETTDSSKDDVATNQDNETTDSSKYDEMVDVKTSWWDKFTSWISNLFAKN